MYRLSETEKYSISTLVSICKDVVKTNNPNKTFNTLKKKYKKSKDKYKKDMELLKKNNIPVDELQANIQKTFGGLSDNEKRDLSIQGILKTISNWIKKIPEDFTNRKLLKALIIDTFIRGSLTGIFAVLCGFNLTTMTTGSFILDVLFIGILGPLSEEISKFCALKADSQGSFLVVFAIPEFIDYTIKYGILKFLAGGISVYGLTMYIVIRWIGVMIHTLTMKIQSNPDSRYSSATKFSLGYIVHITWNIICVLAITLDAYSFLGVLFGLSFIHLMGKIMDRVLNKESMFSNSPEPAYA